MLPITKEMAMFDWNTYTAQVDKKIEENRDECSDWEVAMMPLSQMHGKHFCNIDDGIIDTFIYLMDSLFDGFESASIDGTPECVFGRYTREDQMIHYWIYPSKGEIKINKSMYDGEDLTYFNEEIFSITNEDEIYKFINSDPFLA